VESLPNASLQMRWRFIDLGGLEVTSLWILCQVNTSDRSGLLIPVLGHQIVRDKNFRPVFVELANVTSGWTYWFVIEASNVMGVSTTTCSFSPSKGEWWK